MENGLKESFWRIKLTGMVNFSGKMERSLLEIGGEMFWFDGQ